MSRGHIWNLGVSAPLPPICRKSRYGSEIGGAVEGGALLEAVHLKVPPEVDDESLQLQALLRLVLQELLLAVLLRGYLPGLRAGWR